MRINPRWDAEEPRQSAPMAMAMALGEVNQQGEESKGNDKANWPIPYDLIRIFLAQAKQPVLVRETTNACRAVLLLDVPKDAARFSDIAVLWFGHRKCLFAQNRS